MSSDHSFFPPQRIRSQHADRFIVDVDLAALTYPERLQFVALWRKTHINVRQMNVKAEEASMEAPKGDLLSANKA